MTRDEAVAFLQLHARGSEGTWPYWEIEEGRRVERFSGVVDTEDPMSLLWAYRAASKRLKPNNGQDRKLWLRLIEAYELLVTP